MNHAGTICQCNIGIAGYKECLFILLCSTVICTLIQRFVLFIFQFFSLVSFQYFICRFAIFRELTKYGIKKCWCHIIGISIRGLYLCIFLFRIYTKTDIGWQSPRSCGPCQNIGIFVFHLKSYDCRTFFYILIALCYFLSRQRGSATRAVRNDFKTFIQKLLVPDFF